MNCVSAAFINTAGRLGVPAGAILLLVILSVQLMGQTDVPLLLTTDSSLTGANIILPGDDLSSAWKVMNGDDTAWASPGYDDSGWRKGRSDFYIDSASGKGWTGIGWFRLTIIPDSNVSLPSMGLALFHYGASEIYVNGRLVHRFGVLGAPREKEKGYNPLFNPVNIPLVKGAKNVIAIRYSNYNIIEKTFGFFIPIYPSGILTRIVETDKFVQTRFSSFSLELSLHLILFSVLFTLSILHLLIFIYYSKSRPNFYYSLFALSLALFFLLGSLMLILRQPEPIKYVVVSQMYLLCFIFSFFAMFLLSIYAKKMPGRIWFYHGTAVIIGTLILATMFDPVVRVLLALYILTCLIEGIRVVILAVKSKLDGAVIIAAGVVGFLMIISVFFLSAWISINFIPGWLLLSLFYFGFLSIPASMSVYLARNFSKTSEDLETKFREVKELSEQALAQQRLETELRLQNERKAKELEDARRVQLSMLPKDLPVSGNYEIAVYMQTAAEVGGDYYDFHSAGDELTVVIGDATGHGAKAGLMVTTAKTLFTSYASDPEIVEALKKMSRTIKSMNLGMLYMAMSIFKIEGNKVRYTSAGMPPVFRLCGSGTLEEMNLKAMPLGAFNEFPYGEKEFEFETGDTLMLMTDGFPELMTRSGQLLGYEKVRETLKGYRRLAPEEIIERLKYEINSWLDGESQNDDITFIVIRKK
ncbi:MAG: SpoIIE family protein phosphatase [Ignavibacteriaceae bacterium]|nr:SpoIIE family protein phosphatase [Ignavibacteriaceae bacterium]